MRLRFATLAVLLFPTLAASQGTVGGCEIGEAVRVLETSRIRGAIQNNGVLFRRPGASGGQYIVKDPTNAPNYPSPVFSMSLWVSGHVEGETRVAAEAFGRGEFWPGPLEDASAPPADCSAFDRIWLVSRAEVDTFFRTGVATDDLLEWPHDLGAPVIDGDGDSTNYNLEGGDQPDLLGDVAAWWVMNDAGNAHDSGSAPVGIEVRAHVFAFDSQVFSVVNDATFYRYEIVNRRDEPIDSLRVSLWADIELGSFNDDYVGTDTLRHLAYVYNSTNNDQGGGGYGEAPPAIGIQVLRGLVGLPNGRDDDFDGDVDEAGEVQRMTSAPHSIKEMDPFRTQDYLSLQRGLLSNGSPMVAFGIGIGFPRTLPDDVLVDTTVFAFTGDPLEAAYWSDLDASPEAGVQPNTGFDRRVMATTGPGYLEVGESAVVEFSLPYARGRTNLGSTRALRDFSQQLLGAFGDGFEPYPVRRNTTPPPPPGPESFLIVTPVRPNPTTGAASMVVTLPDPTLVQADVVDVLGRRVAVLEDGVLPEGDSRVDLPELPAGVYIVRLTVAPRRTFTLPFTVVR